MANQDREIKYIAIENLLVDLQNPRYDPRTNQRESLITIATEQGQKLVALAEDIIDKGLNPSELPMVMPSGDNNSFIVIEGNRRITALKLLASPSLVTSIGLPENITKRYKSLHETADDRLPRQIPCTVFPNRDEARHWIYLRHTGENQGVGIVPWDGIQTQRFRGVSATLQAIEFVKNSDYIDDETRKKLPKIAITNIDRILGTPEARELLGVDVKNQQLIFKIPEEEAIARLATVVSDIANRKMKVTDLDSKEQRVEYAKTVVEHPATKSVASPTSRTDPKNGEASDENKVHHRKIPFDRKTLIPGRLKLVITHPRINKIYYELQKLDIKKFVNSCAVMLRVFVELSIDEYAERHGISLKKIVPARTNAKGTLIPEVEKEFVLREKLKTVADYLEKNDICEKAELKGVRTIISNKEHILSVETLNAYVHNKDFHPSDADLKNTWDNLEVFVKRIWSA